MSTVVYLTIMLALVAILTAIVVPALFFRKCPHCRARNLLDASRPWKNASL